MVDAGHSIGGWRPFVKSKRSSPFTGTDALFEDVSGFPEVQNSLSNPREIQFFVFLEFHPGPELIPYFSKERKISEFKDNLQALTGEMAGA
jgi:hypothetical protein